VYSSSLPEVIVELSTEELWPSREESYDDWDARNAVPSTSKHVYQDRKFTGVLIVRPAAREGAGVCRVPAARARVELPWPIFELTRINVNNLNIIWHTYTHSWTLACIYVYVYIACRRGHACAHAHVHAYM